MQLKIIPTNTVAEFNGARPARGGTVMSGPRGHVSGVAANGKARGITH
jgi:hypothetical protein